jgi:acyl-CoA thioester hydrolase
MDALGHVNNTVYLRYVESARIGFFERLGWDVDRFRSERQGPLIVSQSLEYRRQVTYPARLEVGMRPGEIRRRSFLLECGLFLAESEVAVGHGCCVMVWTDLVAGRAMELPARIREMLVREGGRESPPAA